MYSQIERTKVYKKWIDSGKRARLSEHESRVLAEIQTLDTRRPKPVNEVRAFDRLINDAADY
jgi:hypothetical protein